MTDYSGWTPMRIYWRANGPMVDWAYLGDKRFTDPFFLQTITPCMRLPADLLFRHQTPLDDLGGIVGSQPSVRPTGFIFHMSRCGSTLISQMLAASPENIVLSEAGPIDDILRGNFLHPNITDEQRVQWLQWMIGVLAWRRQRAEKNVFIKFDCWHVLFLPLIQRAFPEVPWIFLYREPVEVMASAQKQLGGQMIPGVLQPALLGWTPETIAQMSLYEYAARVLAKLCEAALVQAQAGRGKLVNYRQLPDAIWPALLDYWNVKFPAGENERMLEASQMNAKNPVLPFEADSLSKRESVTPEIRALTQQWMDGVYQQLEAQRLITGFA
jgi:hypothetical protein